MSSIKYEVLTLVSATDTYYSGNSKKAKEKREGIPALVYIVPLLESEGPECKVIDYSTKDYTLVPVSRKRKGERNDY